MKFLIIVIGIITLLLGGALLADLLVGSDLLKIPVDAPIKTDRWQLGVFLGATFVCSGCLLIYGSFNLLQKKH